VLVTANVPSTPILVTPMLEAPRSSETSVLTRVTHRNIPEDAILHSHHRENLKSYQVPKIGPISILRLGEKGIKSLGSLRKGLNLTDCVSVIYVPGTINLKMILSRSMYVVHSSETGKHFQGKKEWCLLGCYAVWLL
jgi:hypothetical protein